MKKHVLDQVQWVRLGSIVRYEGRLQWRRGGMRGLLFVLLGAPVLLGLFQLLLVPLAARGPIRLDLLNAAQLRELHTAYALIYTLPVVLVVGFAVPLIVAEAIPLDRVYGMREVLDALPLPRGIYLAGKVLSVWLPVLGALVGGGSLSAIAAWYVQGPYRIGVLVEFWVGGVIPFTMAAAGLGVLLAAGQPDRRRALLVGMGVIGVGMVLYLLLLNDFYLAAFIRLFMAAAGPAVLDRAPAFPAILSPDYLVRLAAVAAGVAISWLLAWRRLRRTELAYVG